MTELNEVALEAARKAVEDILVEWRDERIQVRNVGNGFVIKEKDGEMSQAFRLSTAHGLSIGIKAYMGAMEAMEMDAVKMGRLAAAETFIEAVTTKKDMGD